jgi:hypothetical protein
MEGEVKEVEDVEAIVSDSVDDEEGQAEAAN